MAFRTADGTKLGAAMEGSVVAFEVDRYDADWQTGWSVLIKGRAEMVDEGTLQTRLADERLRSWRKPGAAAGVGGDPCPTSSPVAGSDDVET